MKRKLICIGMAGMILVTCGFGSRNSYEEYQEAYQAMGAAGSLEANLTLNLKTDTDTVEASGNMKLSQDNEIYYELSVNGKKTVQYIADGKVYSDIDGIKAVYDSAQRPQQEKPEQGKPEQADAPKQKEEGADFEIGEFMQEFAEMLEAGRIKEMGLLDPIPENVIKEITVTEDENGAVYDMEMPESFVETLFNVMIEQQVSDVDYAVKFSNLEDFNCSMHINKDGVLDGMNYSGKTDIEIPAALNGGTEETIGMEIDLKVDFVNPGEVVEIPEIDLADFE